MPCSTAERPTGDERRKRLTQAFSPWQRMATPAPIEEKAALTVKVTSVEHLVRTW